ncbi:MAG TPA: ATP-binding protein [Kofleriaceae bacterium]|nr:ATP-binding protein [Kofleriaceae bacterium]
MVADSTVRDVLADSTCGALIRERDWSQTSLGAIEQWSPALRAMVANLLHARQPMLLFWGPDLIQVYNDSFVPSFGRGKHPAAMGQPARECWADAWPVVGAQIEAVMTRGEPAWHEDALVPIFRNGRLEEVFWTYSYSPAHDVDCTIRGTLVIVTETTGRVLATRRLALLAKLGVALSAAKTYDDVFASLAELVSSVPADVPFLVATAADRVLAQSGISAADAAPVLDVLRDAAVPRTPLELALAHDIATAVWPEPVRAIAASTLTAHGHQLAFGLSPRLPFDDAYRSFLSQIVEQVTATLRRIDKATARDAMRIQRDNLLMHAPVATALLAGPDHVFQLANPLYCELVGRDPTGKSYREAFPELAGTELPGLLDHVYRTGEPVALAEQRVALARHGALEDCYFNFNLEPLRDEMAAVYGMMAVAVDITDQVRARQALEKLDEERNELLRKLADSSRAKDEFFAMLGHELRNPLAPIVTALELMNEKSAAMAPERAIIERQVRHVIRLVDDLLDITRITRGLIQLELRTIDLADVVAAAVDATRHLVQQRGHRLSVDAARGCTVHGDEARLVQIVSNLLTNAARYTPPGGEIRVALSASGGRAYLRVEDTGLGIEPELLPKVFDLFVQGERNVERTEGGLGLGLAIVQNLVRLHGGSVRATSPGRGRGSTFTVELALVDPVVAETAHVHAQPARGDARRVLVVDDNEDAANLLGEIARQRGHEVTVVHDPSHALAAIASFHPEVAVLDIGLPGMDGYELASRLRVACPDCRLIALTGYGQRDDREKALSAGFAAHLVKPVRINELLAMIT